MFIFVLGYLLLGTLQVLDIQKLAAEMGIHCVTTCKLDATKSVCPKGGSIDMVAPCCEEDTCLNIHKSESLKTKFSSNNVPDRLETQSNHGAKCKYLYMYMDRWLCLNYSRIVVAFI